MTVLKNKWEAFLLSHSYTYCPMNVHLYSYNYCVLAVAYSVARILARFYKVGGKAPLVGDSGVSPEFKPPPRLGDTGN